MYTNKHILLLLLGSNLICNLTMRAIKDVNAMIHEVERRDMPMVIRLQFDNASIQKSLLMFGFLSLLVEARVMDEIYAQYLIAGIYE